LVLAICIGGQQTSFEKDQGHIFVWRHQMGERPGDYHGASLPDLLARLRRPAAVTAGRGPTVPAHSHVLYSRRRLIGPLPLSRKYEGVNTNDVKDANGKLGQVELIKMAQERGSGWVDYLWPKPRQS
jgi:hypothetical protein